MGMLRRRGQGQRYCSRRLRCSGSSSQSAPRGRTGSTGFYNPFGFLKLGEMAVQPAKRPSRQVLALAPEAGVGAPGTAGYAGCNVLEADCGLRQPAPVPERAAAAG